MPRGGERRALPMSDMSPLSLMPMVYHMSTLSLMADSA